MMWKRIWLTLAVAGSLVAGTVAAAAALDRGDSNESAASVEEAEVAEPAAEPQDQVLGKGFVVVDGEFEEDFEELPQELIDEINAETDALVEYLNGLGYQVTVETDEDGIKEPVFDEENEELGQAIDDFFTAQFAEEVATWTDEEKAEWNAGIDELVAELAAAGTTVETTEIAPGVHDIVWTDEIEEALWELEKDFFDLEENFEDLPPELIEEINTETDALVDYLTGLGYQVTVETDEDGINEPVFDEEDEELGQAIDDFYTAQFAAEAATWTDEEKAGWNAGIDELVAELAAEGITVETTEIAPGVQDIVWTNEIEEALCDLDHFFEIEGEFEKDFDVDVVAKGVVTAGV